jgi:hypothetical protein
VRIAQKAGVDGRLFGSVTNADIAEALTKMGLAVQKSQVRMPNGPLKTVGEHTVSVAPHTDVVVESRSVVPWPTERLSCCHSRAPVNGPAMPAFSLGRPAVAPSSPGCTRVVHKAPTDCPQDCPQDPTDVPAEFLPIRVPTPVRDDEVARLRVPPHSIEAEQSVLGGLLLDNLAWDRAADLLTDSDFYRYEHR